MPHFVHFTRPDFQHRIRHLYLLEHDIPFCVLSPLGSGDNSLSEQLSNNAQARALKLELENRRLLSTIDNLKESSFHESSYKILELEKDKKRLSLKVKCSSCTLHLYCVVWKFFITKFNINLFSIFVGHCIEVGIDVNTCLVTRTQYRIVI
jgi:hypothetical protein